MRNRPFGTVIIQGERMIKNINDTVEYVSQQLFADWIVALPPPSDSRLRERTLQNLIFGPVQTCLS